MKPLKLILFVSVVVLIYSKDLLSQNDSTRGKHEIDVGYLDVFGLFNAGFHYDEEIFHFYAMTGGITTNDWNPANEVPTYGIGYKYHYKKIAAR